VIDDNSGFNLYCSKAVFWTPNVEVNRRAEGTSELNRRLGDGVKGDWVLERCGVAGDYGWSLAGKQARRACADF